MLCLAGRGPLDEAVAAMLAQLLGKHGLAARVVPHEAASRAGIGSLDVAGVSMVCVCYLEISGSPSHLRYLLRRIRHRVPDAPILVGLWPAEDSVLKDARLRAAVGADYYTTSLREAVNTCLEVARTGRETAQVARIDQAPLAAAGAAAEALVAATRYAGSSNITATSALAESRTVPSSTSATRPIEM